MEAARRTHGASQLPRPTQIGEPVCSWGIPSAWRISDAAVSTHHRQCHPLGIIPSSTACSRRCLPHQRAQAQVLGGLAVNVLRRVHRGHVVPPAHETARGIEREGRTTLDGGHLSDRDSFGEMLGLDRPAELHGDGHPVQSGVRFDRTSTVVIGDTSGDVLAAHAGGARVAGVASGRDGADVLREAGAEVVLPDLTATARGVSAAAGLISGKNQPPQRQAPGAAAPARTRPPPRSPRPAH
jgi:hypothetical protein